MAAKLSEKDLQKLQAIEQRLTSGNAIDNAERDSAKNKVLDSFESAILNPNKSQLKKIITTYKKVSEVSQYQYNNSKILLNMLLVHAAMLQELDSLKIILKEGQGLVDPNYHDKDTLSTGLMHAAYHGNLEMVKLFLSLNVDVNVLNREKLPAFMLAMSAASKLPDNNPPDKNKIHRHEKTKTPKLVSNTAKLASKAYLKDYIEILMLLLPKTTELSVTDKLGFNALHYAINLENLQLVKSILDKNPDLSQVSNVNGINPLMYALEVFPQAFDLIFQSFKGNINAKDKFGHTLLNYALEKISDSKERFQILEALFKAGADPRASALFYFFILEKEDHKILRLTMAHDKNKDFSKLRGIENESLLSRTIKLNNLAMATTLLQTKQVDLEETNEFGETLFHLALIGQRPEIAKALLLAGAKPLVFRKDGASSLQTAVFQSYPDILSQIFQKASQNDLKEKINQIYVSKSNHNLTLLHCAIYFGQVACLKLLLEANLKMDLGLDFSLLTNHNESPFNLIFQNPTLTKETRLEILKLLLQALPKDLIQKMINIQDKEHGLTPLYAACEWGDEEAVSLLLQQGADQNIVINDGVSPLTTAAFNGHANVLKQLLNPEFNPNVNFRTPWSATPLMQAVIAESPECIDLLVNAGADIEARTDIGETALMIAAIRGNSACLQALIDKKANIEAQNINNWTVLHSAVYQGRTEAVQLLVKAGANPNALNIIHDTPIATAALNGNIACLRSLCENSRIKPDFSIQNKEDGGTALSVAKDARTAEYLRSQGAQGVPILCTLNLIDTLTSNGCLEEAEKYLPAIDLGNTFFFKYRNFTYSPIFTYANHTKKELKLLVLKHKLYQNFIQTFDKPLIDRFMEIFKDATQDFNFSEDGSINFSMNRNHQDYSLSLSEKNLEIILMGFKDNNYSVHSSKQLEKQIVILKDNLWKYSNENKSLLEEEEINRLKDQLIAKQHSCSTHLERGLSLLAQIMEELSNSPQKTETKIAEIEKSYDEILTTLKLSSQETLVLLKTSSIEASLHSKLQAKILNFSSLLEKQTQLYTRLKQISDELKEKEASKAGVFSGKSKQKRKKQKTKPKKKAEAILPQTNTLKTQKPTSSLSASQLQDLLRASEEQTKVLKQFTQKSQITPKTTAFLPKIPATLPRFQSVERNFETRSYVKIPKHTLEHASELGSLTRAKDGLTELKRTVEQIGVEGNKVNNINNENSDLETQANALKGALAQALESRKDLKEKWPNHIRNILFRNEAILKKHYSEQQLILIITEINSNIERLATPESLKQSAGRLDIEKIDVQGFLKRINDEFTVPEFSLKSAQEMIAHSKSELKKYKTLIQNQGESALNNPVLIHAIGFTWARMGTHFVEINRNKPHEAPDPNQKTCSTFGKQYRHNDPAWKPKVLSFIQKALMAAPEKTDSQKTAPGSDTLNQNTVTPIDPNASSLHFQYTHQEPKCLQPNSLQTPTFALNSDLNPKGLNPKGSFPKSP